MLFPVRLWHRGHCHSPGGGGGGLRGGGGRLGGLRTLRGGGGGRLGPELRDDGDRKLEAMVPGLREGTQQGDGVTHLLSGLLQHDLGKGSEIILLRY